MLDIYGELLSERQRDIMDLYFNEDLSLSEISENVGISRQGAHDTIKRSELQLRFYEAKLHFNEIISSLKTAASENDKEKLYELIEKL